MEEYVIRGKRPLYGKIRVHGSKNAVLPILAATILNGGISVIENVPDIQDVRGMLAIMDFLGCGYSFEDGVLVVESGNLREKNIPKELADKIRTSILFCGPMLARFGRACVSKPGGCAIGLRPIDIHLEAFKAMGVKIQESGDCLELTATRLHGIDFYMSFPSVGATQNIMMAATMAEGITRIHNPAKEPEVVELANFINGMGGKVTGSGTDCIEIQGELPLSDTGYYLKGDRIVAGTYMAACGIAGGKIQLEGICSHWCNAFLDCFKEMGCSIICGAKSVEMSSTGELVSPGLVTTQPYPGFPTDMQPQLMSMMAVARGISAIKETIFENRFQNAAQLCKMGAHIEIHQNMAFIEGRSLKGGETLVSHDLRGGAALIVAALGTDGETIVQDCGYIKRGYENIRRDLQLLGADIV